MARDDRRDDYDDYDDRPRGPRGGEMGPLDGLFKMNIVLLILFGLCCSGIAFILALICYFTAKDPQAKSNAMIVIIIGLVIFGLNLVLYFTGAMAGVMGR